MNKNKIIATCILFLISTSLLVSGTSFLASAASTVTYQGTVSLTTTVTAQDDEWNYPDQTLTRTCVVACPFAGLTLSSYDGGSTYSGTVYGQQGTFASDWSISPTASTSDQGVTRTFSPASGQTSAGFSMQIYAEISGGVLTFIFNPDTSLLQNEIKTGYTYATSTQPAGTSTPVTFTAPSAHAYNTLNNYCTNPSSQVIIPKSSSPFQSQTIQFNGQKTTSNDKSFQWTGTISLSTDNQAAPTATPTPDNQGSTDTPTPIITAAPTATAAVTDIPVTGAETAQVMNIRGTVQISKGGSGAPQTVTGSTTVSTGDRVTTGPNSWVTIQFSDGSKVDIGPNSDWWLESRADSNEFKNIKLVSGLIHLWEHFKAGDKKFMIRALAFAMAIRGTELTVSVNDTCVTVVVIDGIVDIENTQTGDLATLEASQELSVTRDMNEQQMNGNIQPVDVSAINQWWNASTFPDLTTILIVGVVVAVVVLAVALILVRRRRQPLPPPPPPPPI